MRRQRWPEASHRLPDPDAPVLNPFADTVVAARYAQARPALHHHVVELLAARLPRADRAIDVGCGTGLSTRPLAVLANTVVGIDVSEEMLGARASRDAARYVIARAERMPFPDATFGLATVASAIHWFEPEAIRELGRVLLVGAPLAIYDVWFRAEMAGVEEFHEWMMRDCVKRYERAPGNDYTPRSFEVAGFQPAWSEDRLQKVPMKLDELVEYLMTHSERIAAIRDGREKEAEQRAFLTQGVGNFFEGVRTRTMGFGLEIEAFLRVR
jgi:SAM-dependent methyltransferase